MTDKRIFILNGPQPRQNALQHVKNAPEGYEVVVKPATRNSDQNARMWAQLADVSRQVVWHGKRLTPTDWKHVFSSALKRMEVVPNLDGSGFVALGMSTSVMTKREMADLIDLMSAFGAEHGVEWSEQERVAA